MPNKINSLFLVIFIFSVIITGCDSDNIGGSGNNFNFSIPIFDYSDSHFLVDTLYKSSFLDYNNNTSGVFTQHTNDNRILSNDNSFEVWVQCEATEISKRLAVGYVMLYEKPAGGYPDSLKNPAHSIAGEIFIGYFRKLTQSEYYVSEYAGMIGFKINIPNDYHAGIVYRTNEGKEFGQGSYGSGTQDTLILKMFKTSNPNPEFNALAWELKLKNIYRLPINNVLQDQFDLDIYFYENGVYAPRIPGTVKDILEITQLDRYQGSTHIPPPDGRFDFLPGYTIIPETGNIIFPTFRPFYDELRFAGADSVYWFPELYEQQKAVAQTMPNATRFYIMGYAVSGP